MEITIRAARAGDAEALCDIYNGAVANTTATMDTEPRPLENQRDWLTAHNGDPYPALVAEFASEETSGGRVVGYASLSPYNPKRGYFTTTENSVYVHPEFHGRGVGAALLSALISEARARGFRIILALITADNEPSLRLHARHGFTDSGTLRKVGRKFGQWVDVTFMQLELTEETEP